MFIIWIFNLQLTSLSRCLASARTVVKVVRLTDVKVLQRLLYNGGCKVQIVHLIRDPRPSIRYFRNDFYPKNVDSRILTFKKCCLFVLNLLERKQL